MLENFALMASLGLASSGTHEITQWEQWADPFLPACGVTTAAMPRGTWREEWRGVNSDHTRSLASGP
ncbi:hypothetical protein HPG69_007272 [Diceros bicornis minor]|uniref:Uncharacterized protein n=1 Tax=Diceros bicornis minor TaxID=77932 RepID=A0A7J7FNQ9_DICBM|nr:hypothetical protein HPG69_007272 [Diceros bicornis minor]